MLCFQKNILLGSDTTSEWLTSKVAVGLWICLVALRSYVYFCCTHQISCLLSQSRRKHINYAAFTSLRVFGVQRATFPFDKLHKSNWSTQFRLFCQMLAISQCIHVLERLCLNLESAGPAFQLMRLLWAYTCTQFQACVLDLVHFNPTCSFEVANRPRRTAPFHSSKMFVFPLISKLTVTFDVVCRFRKQTQIGVTNRQT